jgi:hypothetical protein
LLNRGSTDQQVIGGEHDALGRLLSADLPGYLGCAAGDGIYRDMFF